MSRIAKVPVVVPKGVEVQLVDGGTGIKVKGPKGEISKKFAPVVKIVLADGQLTFEKTENSNFGKMMLGTVSSIVRSMVKGVQDGFEKSSFRGFARYGSVAGSVYVRRRQPLPLAGAQDGFRRGDMRLFHSAFRSRQQRDSA